VRILILNWRDVRSPHAGGAELLTHEVARRLVARGHEVTWFTSRPPGLPERELVDGVQVVRRGSELTTRFAAPRFARGGRWDVLLEEINTLPYLSPLWSAVPTVLLIHQLARDVWWYESPLPLAPVGFAAEPVYLQAYGRCPKITISASTRDDLRGLGLDGPVHIVPVAVNARALPRLPPKEPTGRLLSVGRLVPSKRHAHAVRALVAVRRRIESASLTIAGDGPELRALTRLARELGVTDAVTLAGRVSETEKHRLLEEADLLLGCSVREGWGLTVTEAARLGTPAVAYDIPGFRDSIVHERTGLLAPVAPAALAAAAADLLLDLPRYERLRTAAWERWRDLDWERTADAFERVLAERRRPEHGRRFTGRAGPAPTGSDNPAPPDNPAPQV
jgi:glycosyltransferase involved in cell wall biosynthesis